MTSEIETLSSNIAFLIARLGRILLAGHPWKASVVGGRGGRADAVVVVGGAEGQAHRELADLGHPLLPEGRGRGRTQR